jgi:hypothetical protein
MYTHTHEASLLLLLLFLEDVTWNFNDSGPSYTSLLQDDAFQPNTNQVVFSSL